MVDFSKLLKKKPRLFDAGLEYNNRFTRRDKTPMNDYPGSFHYTQARVNFTTESDKAFWRDADKVWAWHCFLTGSDATLITEFVGGRPEDFNQWVRDVCAGREKCNWSGSFTHWKWTARKDRLLLRMKREKLEFYTACRLLGFSPAQVKERLRFFKNSEQFNDHG